MLLSRSTSHLDGDPYIKELRARLGLGLGLGLGSHLDGDPYIKELCARFHFDDIQSPNTKPSPNSRCRHPLDLVLLPHGVQLPRESSTRSFAPRYTNEVLDATTRHQLLDDWHWLLIT